MKYVFIDLEVRNGEYEYNCKSVHITECTSIEFFAQRYASTFYGCPDGRTFGGDTWYFNGGEVSATVDELEEIPEETYNILKKYL